MLQRRTQKTSPIGGADIYSSQQFVCLFQFRYMAAWNVIPMHTLVSLKAFIDEHASMQSSTT